MGIYGGVLPSSKLITVSYEISWTRAEVSPRIIKTIHPQYPY